MIGISALHPYPSEVHAPRISKTDYISWSPSKPTLPSFLTYNQPQFLPSSQTTTSSLPDLQSSLDCDMMEEEEEELSLGISDSDMTTLSSPPSSTDRTSTPCTSPTPETMMGRKIRTPKKLQKLSPYTSLFPRETDVLVSQVARVLEEEQEEKQQTSQKKVRITYHDEGKPVPKLPGVQRVFVYYFP